MHILARVNYKYLTEHLREDRKIAGYLARIEILPQKVPASGTVNFKDTRYTFTGANKSVETARAD